MSSTSPACRLYLPTHSTSASNVAVVHQMTPSSQSSVRSVSLSTMAGVSSSVTVTGRSLVTLT